MLRGDVRNEIYCAAYFPEHAKHCYRSVAIIALLAQRVEKKFNWLDKHHESMVEAAAQGTAPRVTRKSTHISNDPI